jgi:hypothetical protein
MSNPKGRNASIKAAARAGRDSQAKITEVEMLCKFRKQNWASAMTNVLNRGTHANWRAPAAVQPLPALQP